MTNGATFLLRTARTRTRRSSLRIRYASSNSVFIRTISLALGRAAEIAAERRFEREAVRHDVVAEPRQRDVEAERIDVGAKQSGRWPRSRIAASVATIGEISSRMRVDPLIYLASCRFSLLMRRSNSGMIAIVIPDEMRETRHRFDGRDAVEFERAFGFVERAERMFEHGGE